MIKESVRFSKELEKVNEWWITGSFGPYGVKRKEYLDAVISETDSKRAILVTGPRRAGKTTIMRQTISYLLKEKEVSPDNILYISLDDPIFHTLSDSLIEDTINFFLENIAKGSSAKKYIFFDEVQALQDWYKWVKSFQDKYGERNSMKFILSGSSSLHLQREANLYLRGRVIDIQVYPLSFHEFLYFNSINVETLKFSDVDNLGILDISKIGKKVKSYFDDYMLVGGFPEWFEVRDVRKWFEKITNDIPKRAIYEDITSLYQIRSPRILENIFAYMVENQSKILSYETINEVAGLQRGILLNYIEYLKSSYLTIEIQKYAKGIKERIKSKKKFLILDQGIRNAMLKEHRLNIENIGFIVENIIGVHLYRNGEVHYLRTNGEVDFVLSKGKTLIPVEAKYRESPEVPKTLLKFMTDKNLKHGIVATKDIFKKEGNIYFLPVWLFLLIQFGE